MSDLIKTIKSNKNLKNLEVFKSIYSEIETEGETLIDLDTGETEAWFYWFSLPGCLPDSEPFGPFATEKAALLHAFELFGGYN